MAEEIEGYFEDNFFDLIPGRGQKIRFFTQSSIEKVAFENALSIMTLFDLMELG